MTVAFIGNAAGGKVTEPIVIWKSKTPCCFKYLKDKSRPANVHYCSNEKSWMNSDIMIEILSKLDREMKFKNRNVILFLDNAACHPPDLEGKFSNIKVCFLPKNTISRLQPLNAGIIQTFKVKYCKLLLKFVISRINDKKTAAEMVQEADILKAVRWVSEAWSVMSEDTIAKCFQKCGFIREICEEAESAEIDKEFEELVRRIDSDVAPAGYIAADDTVQFCHEPINTGKKNWRALLREEVFNAKTNETTEPHEKICQDSDSEDDCVDDEPTQPKILSFSEAIGMMDDLNDFAERRLQDESLVSSLNKVCCLMQNLRIQNLRQKRISDFSPGK